MTPMSIDRICNWQWMIRYGIYPLIFAVMCTCVLSMAHGQELGTQTIEQRAHQAQEASTVAIPPEELILPGEEDLVLLRRPKLFTIESNSSYQFTDNAFLSDKSKTHDHVLSQSILLRAGTRIARRGCLCERKWVSLTLSSKSRPRL